MFRATLFGHLRQLFQAKHYLGETLLGQKNYFGPNSAS
jgi:hypothetical protein